MKATRFALNPRCVLSALIIGGALSSASAQTVLNVRLIDGTSKAYTLDDKAVVKFENANMVYSGRDWQFIIPLATLSDWSYSVSSSAIGSVTADGEVSCVCEGDNFVISGLSEGDSYSVYAVDGKTMTAGQVKGERLSVDTRAWPAGVYVIASGKHTIKTVKR